VESALSGKILGVSTKSFYFIDNVKTVSGTVLALDILLVAIIFYWIYLFLRETRAMRILYGLFLLFAVMALGKLLDLALLNWILKYFAAILVVAIPVVFQPELRAALEKLGRARLINDLSFSKERFGKVIALSQHKIGGLIILQRQTGLREYIENGTAIDAAVTKDLLLSIFFPRSPLHDGAVIIVGDRIVSARSILPVSSTQIGSDMGTRHKAAIGITENSDAVSVVVSEETGSISLAVGGKIERRISEERLRNRLSGLLRQNKG
jgi:diadenylate cyclase